MNVLVYNGRGVSVEALHHTVRSLRASVGAYYDVKLVGANTLAKEPWEGTCSLLVIPGGRDTPYEEDLSGRATDRIRQWIHSGAGRFLGICAGAYVACAQVSFEPESASLAVVGRRALSLCPAIAKGTLFPGFEYGTNHGAHAAIINVAEGGCEEGEKEGPRDGTGTGQEGAQTMAKDPIGATAKTIPMLYNGGCWFDFGHVDPAEKMRFTTIGVYEEREEKPAIVVGHLKGAAHWSVLLSGVHLEYAVEELIRRKPAIASMAMMDSLRVGEMDRLALWNWALTRLGLKTMNSVPAEIGEAAIPLPTPLYLFDADGDVAWLQSKVSTDGDQWKCQGTTFKIFTDAERAESSPVTAESYPLVIGTPPSIHRQLQWTFSPEKYFAFWKEDSRMTSKRRKAGRTGGMLLYAEYIGSTQTILSQNYQMATELPSGSIVLGGDQLAGKGRGTNTWLSSKGCLQFTLVQRHANSESLSLMQYLVGLAMVEALISEPDYAFLESRLKLKWPNDLYSCQKDGTELRKLGGILVNSQTGPHGDFLLLIGFGFNVHDTPWTRSLNDVVEEQAERTGHYLLPWSKEKVLARFVQKFGDLYERMEGAGRGFPFNQYYKHWLHGGQVVFLEEEQLRVRIEGIDKNGYLIARPHTDGLLGLINDGEGGTRGPFRSSSDSMGSSLSSLDSTPSGKADKTFLLQPDGNSFDMMKNLIKRKA